MPSSYEVSPLSGIPTAAKINEELNGIKTSLDEKLDRKPLTGNQMEDDIDANSFNVINLAEANALNDAATLGQVRYEIDEVILEVAQGIDGLIPLYGSEETVTGTTAGKVVGDSSFVPTINVGLLTLSEGACWFPSVPNLLYTSGSVDIDFSAEADGDYTVFMNDSGNLLFVDDGTEDATTVNLYTVSVASGVITGTVEYPDTDRVFAPTDFVGVTSSTEDATDYETLDDRLESIEVDLNQAEADIVQNGLDIDQNENDIAAHDTRLDAIEAVVGPQETGWTASTGTANKGAFDANATQDVSVIYTESEVQQIQDDLTAARQRIKALEDALRNHGLID